MTERIEALRICADLRPRISGWREQAKLACVANPMLWLAVHGVPLAEYLRQLDKLEEVCAAAEDKLAKDAA